MILKTVIDTNVVVSAVWSEKGNCARIIADILDGQIEFVCSQSIFNEYQNVLKRRKFSFPHRKIETLLTTLREHAEFVSPDKSDILFIDEADRKFYDAARMTGAYLITGNKRHYPTEPEILAPAEFLLL